MIGLVLTNHPHNLEFKQANEQTRHLIVVHVYDESRPVPPELAEHVRMIDEVRRQWEGWWIGVRWSD